MGKKSQITLVIAATILIFLIAALAFYIAGYYKENPVEPLAFNKASIENYINNCIKKTAEEGLRQYGRKGFAANSPEIPSIEEVQNQMSSYVTNNLNACLNDFEDFKSQGWDVEKSDFYAKAQVNEQDVSFDVNYPLKVSDKANAISFERFASIVNVRLKYIHEIASKIVEFKFKYGKEADLTALSEYDLEITIFPDKNTFVYVIDDKKSLIMNEPYRFRLTLTE